MTTITDATSSPPLQPTGSNATKPNAGAADVASSTSNTASAATNAPAAKTSSSVATISTIATQLQAAQAASSSDAVFSTTKVNEIKQAISEGRFQVNSAKVADGLLDSVHDLLKSRQGS